MPENKKKIGAGFLNGFGGKFDDSVDKDIWDTNFREAKEDINIKIKIAKKVGEIIFHNPSDDDELKHMRVHIFIATEWDGEPEETSEMKKIAWYKISKIDYDNFLPADRLFIPQILDGKYIKGLIEYNDDWSVKSNQIDEVDESFFRVR